MDIGNTGLITVVISATIALAVLTMISRYRAGREVVLSRSLSRVTRHQKQAQPLQPVEKRRSLLARSQVISVYNIKGGVGKTSSAVNLAYKLSALGHKTLLWDMDPQGATSFYLNCEEGIAGGLSAAVSELTLDKTQRQILASVRESAYDNLYVLPADASFRHLDIEVAAAQLENQFIKQFLAPFRETFDYIVVDCPPGLTVAVESLLNVTDQIVSPVVPSPLSVRMFEELKAFIREQVPSKPRLTAFFSLVDGRKSLHKNTMQQLLEQNRQIMLPVVIPYSADMERMGSEKAPVTIYAKGVAADKAFDQLTEKLRA